MKVPRKQYTESRYFGRSGSTTRTPIVGNWFSQEVYGAVVMENERLLRENEQLRERLSHSWKAKADDRLKIIRLLQAEVKFMGILLDEKTVPPVVTTPDGAFPNADWARRDWPPSRCGRCGRLCGRAPATPGARLCGLCWRSDWDTHHG